MVQSNTKFDSTADTAGGFAYMGPGDSFNASDANGSFSAQLTAATLSAPVIAFNYKFAAVHVAAAISPVTTNVLWKDDRTPACLYSGKPRSILDYLHWACATKGGARGYLNGPMSYRFAGGTATITVAFTAYMKSWPGN